MKNPHSTKAGPGRVHRQGRPGSVQPPADWADPEQGKPAQRVDPGISGRQAWLRALWTRERAWTGATYAAAAIIALGAVLVAMRGCIWH